MNLEAISVTPIFKATRLAESTKREGTSLKKGRSPSIEMKAEFFSFSLLCSQCLEEDLIHSNCSLVVE